MKLSQKSIPHRTYKFIQKNNLIQSGQKVIVAVSGGADSIALLDILLTLQEKLNIKISVCHFNHRLRGVESDGDEKFVREFCKMRDIECIVDRAENKNQYKSEEKARDARYGFFKKILKEGRGDTLATAHNQNDQVETFLLRLARGSGIYGLKSIPSQREKIIRPLLPINRTEIEQYLKDRRLKHKTDSTNKNLNFDRNYVRHQILPLFEKLNPRFSNSLSSTIGLIEDDTNFLEKIADEKLRQISKVVGNTIIEIDYKKWLAQDHAIQKIILRRAIEKLIGLKDITSVQIQAICELFIKSIGKKHKILPRSLRAELISGKIVLSV
jgi:tRNA(Ile)-lysidine synthase